MKIVTRVMTRYNSRYRLCVMEITTNSYTQLWLRYYTCLINVRYYLYLFNTIYDSCIPAAEITISSSCKSYITKYISNNVNVVYCLSHYSVSAYGRYIRTGCFRRETNTHSENKWSKILDHDLNINNSYTIQILNS